MLDDLAIDTPMAPKLLGVMTAQLIIEGTLEMAFFVKSASSVEDMMCRRDFAAAVLKEMKAKGKTTVAAAVKAGGVDLPALLTGDPEFDSALPEFLEKSGLKELNQ